MKLCLKRYETLRKLIKTSNALKCMYKNKKENRNLKLYSVKYTYFCRSQNKNEKEKRCLNKVDEIRLVSIIKLNTFKFLKSL